MERKRALGVNEVDESTSGYVKPPVNKDMPDYDHDAVMQELKELEPVEVPEMPSAAVLVAARAAAGEEIYQPLDDVDDHSDVSAADANVDADVDNVGETGNGGEEMDDAAEGEQDDTGSRSDDDDAQNLRAQRIRWVGQRQTFLYSATAIVKNMKSLKDRKNSGKKKRMKLKGTLTGMKDQSALPEHLRE